MIKKNFSKYRKGRLILQIESLMPERFVNLLWKNGVHIKKIRKKNIASMIMEVNLSDYDKIEEVAKSTNVKIKIINRKGIIFSLLKLRKRKALLIGAIFFLAVVYYLSTYIWRIEINTENNVSPYEVRLQLKSIGIKEGMSKKKLNIKRVEERILNNNENIMWVKVRTHGSKLSVDISERQTPPSINIDETPCNLVAKKDGQIMRIYTTSGTAVVQPGDIVKKGQLLVKGEQGKEENIYQVHAKGSVIAKTYYEDFKVVPLKGSKTVRTGKKIANYYLKINNRKIYIKKNNIKYKKYERKQNKGAILGKEYYYEVKDNSYNLDCKKVTQDIGNELYSKMIVNLDKSVKIVDKAIDYKLEGDICTIRVLLTTEEEISLQESINNDSQ